MAQKIERKNAKIREKGRKIETFRLVNFEKFGEHNQ